MHAYVMASSEFGPSKVGISSTPEKRRRGLQTGHPEPLITYYKVRIRDENEARLVEQIAHWSLRRVRAEADNEWFEVSTSEATIALYRAAAAVAALRDTEATFDELSHKSILCWLKSVEEHRFALDDEGRDSTTLDELQAPNMLQILACSRRPAAGSFNFNDYLDTWPEGPWHRAVRHSRGLRRPSGSSFGQYLEVADVLSERNIDEGAHAARRWIEWSFARDLTDFESAELRAVWGVFAERYNTLERKDPYIPAHGRDDRVDDVELFAQLNDPRRPGRQCAVFEHEHFRAVLFPRQAFELHSYDRFARSVLRPLTGQIKGFVAPVVGQSLWSEPLATWLRETPKRRDAALARLLGNPSKRYPEVANRQPVEYGTALALVHNELPRVELTGAA